MHAELGELIDEVERLGGRQLVGARAAGARPAVPTREVARERDLPDGEDRPGLRVEGADLVGEVQLAPRRAWPSGPGEAASSKLSPAGAASVHWIR